MADKIKSARALYDALKKELDEIRGNRQGGIRERVIAGGIKADPIREIKCSRTLKGHGAEITSFCWSGDGVTLGSVGKDGQVIIWNGLHNRKIQVISHKTQWLMACSFERTESRLIAAGGADRTCSVFISGQPGMVRPSAVLSGHDGYLSACHFIDEHEILTASGDSTVILWDVAGQKIKTRFTEHAADCMSVTAFDEHLFASGSADSTVKIWDSRTGKSTHTFLGHTSDVNSVVFFPSGQGVATASTDSTCRFFDMRCYAQTALFEINGSDTPATSGTFFFYCV